MSNDPALSETIGKASDELDPLPAVLPPEGVVVVRLGAIAARPGPRVDVTGVRGSADAAVVAALVQAGAADVVVVAPDADGARRLAADVSFLLGAVNAKTQADEGDAGV